MTSIIKFGGTLITNKNSHVREIKQDVLDFLSREISYIKDEKLIVVHGGGSFGHPLAIKHGIKYGASYRRPKTEQEYLNNTISRDLKRSFYEISESMKDLNSYVINSLRKYNVDAVPVHPHEFCLTKKGKINQMPLGTVVGFVNLDLKPVMHGDVVLDSEWDLAILSGDQILMQLALEKELYVDRIFLLTDVNGVYDKDPNVYQDTQKYDIVTPKIYKELRFETKKFDVTGGMREKVNLCLKLADRGIMSEILNPISKKHVLRDIINGDIEGYGTIIKED